MATLDTALFIKCIRSNRLDEARALLDAFFAEPMTTIERGAAQAAVASAFLEFQTEANDVLSGLLASGLERLKKIDAFEEKSRDAIDLARVHANINQLQK